jgi:hypothetical protein
MLTIFADNTMILGTIYDRQDMPVVTTSTILRGIERLAVRVLRAVVPVVAVYAHVNCAARAAASCPSFSTLKHWQLGLGGKRLQVVPLGSGRPVGSGNLNLRYQIAG